MSNLRKDPKNRALQKQIRDKRKSLKDLYYHEMALAINCAADARQVGKEFQLAKSYAMHKPRSKIDISKDKFTKHFKQHFFAERLLEMPAELEHPESFEYLKGIPIEVNEDPPDFDEIQDAAKTFKNNKSSCSNNV